MKRTKSFMPRQESLRNFAVGVNAIIGRDRNGKEQTTIDFLENDPFFHNLKKAQIKKLVKCFEVKKYHKNEVIVKKGDPSDSLYIIAHGVVEFSDNRQGEKVVMRKFAAGEMFGEFGLVNRSPRTLTATAYTDDVALLKLTRDMYMKNLGKPFMEPIEERVAKINKTMLAGGLVQVDFLKDIPVERIQEIGDLFKYEFHRPGDTLFNEGDKGDRFYLVYSGTLVVTVKDDLGFDIELTRLKPGKTFGERSLLQDTQRSATITTLEQTELFSLGRYEFKQFRYFFPEINQKLIEKLNKAPIFTIVPIFQSLSVKQKMNLDSIAVKKTFKPGQVIFRQGESKSFALYIITDGAVEVYVETDGEAKLVRTLTEGKYFGEVSLVSKEVHGHTATIQVEQNSECSCLLIDKNDFDNLLQESPSVKTEMQMKILGDDVGLDQLLLHPLGRASFLEYCESEYATENVEFWQEVSVLENLGERKIAKSVLVALKRDIEAIKRRKQEMLEERANDIVKKFILPNAPSEVNIPAEMREELVAKVKKREYSYDMFATAKGEIFRLIQADNFTRYKKSPHFKEVLDKIGQYDK